MNIIKAAVAAGIVALAPAAALADGMSYSYVELNWVQNDIDGVGPKLDGFGLRGSVGFAENFFAYANFTDQSISAVDLQTWSVGLGGHWALGQNLDFVANLGWAKAEADAFGFSVDEDGYEVGIGLRGRPVESLELEGGVTYTDFGSSAGDDTAVSVGARWFFTKNFAVGARVSHSDDVTGIEAGIRLSF